MKKTSLIILDGWGHGEKNEANAIFNSHTPYIDSLYQKYPNTELNTDGNHVGLPQGQMGNSEVGHLNIGAGRVVYQDLEKINQEIASEKIKENKTLIEAMTKANKSNKPLHIMGLLSDGGIHSHINHLKAICDIATDHKINNIFIHIFTDGRDSDPKGGIGYIVDLLDYIEDKNIKIASVIGRYYSMDRDKRWERTSLVYNMLVHGKGKKTKRSDIIINATYEGCNEVSKNIGKPNSFEYQVTNVMEISSKKFKSIGFALMDGSFFSFLPMGTKKNKQVLYHVTHSVLKREIGNKFNYEWLKRNQKFKKIINLSNKNTLGDLRKYLPEIDVKKINKNYISSRVLLPKTKKTAKRISYFKEPQKNYFEIFSGKVDHSVDIANKIYKKISKIKK